MLLSMTGYGKAVCQLTTKQIIIEIKTLNSKNADIVFKAPAIFRERESEIRKMIIRSLTRGKIECYVSETFVEQNNDVVINHKIIADYLSQLEPVLKQYNIETNADIFRAVLGMPNVYEEQQEEISESEWKKILLSFQEVLDKVNMFRKSEGESMLHDIMQHHQKIQLFLEQVSQFETKRIETLTNRWRKSLEQLKIEVDDNRFEQELVFYLDKLDISEEKSRLANHIHYFEETVNNTEISAKGKKLGFIVQEMNREINTLGAKANDANIQQLVVGMKDELEKIREQLGNIL